MKLLPVLAALIVLANTYAQTFVSLNSGVSVQLNALDFSSPSTGMVVGNSGVIRKTVDAGLHWTTSNSGVGYDLNAIAFLNGSTYLVAGNQGTILKSTNAGTSWSIVNSGTNNDLTGIYVNGLTTYITGDNGTVLISTNSGSAWTVVNSGISFRLNKICFITPQIGFAVGAGGTILKTVNAGQSWSIQTSGTNTHNLTDIYFTGANAGVITGGITGSNEAIILRTVNAGAVWTSDEFSGAILNGLGFYPDNSIGFAVGGSFSGNTSVILKTTSQGASWLTAASTSSRQLAACFPDNGIGYTCGLNGTILRLATNTLEIEEPENEPEVQVTPNPGKGLFLVSVEGSDDISIEVFSGTGERVVSSQHTGAIDLSAYPAGNYPVVIRTERTVFMRTLVKE